MIDSKVADDADLTLVDLLAHRAQYQSDQTAFVFLADGEVETERVTYGELDQQARAIAAELQCRPGERALLVYPSGLEFIAALFGCLYAGAIAVPVSVPRRHQHLARWSAIAADAGATVVLTTAAVQENLRHRISKGQQHRWLVSENLTSSSWVPRAIAPETRAILQYTSGSTGQPKGVILTHGNLLHNERAIQVAYEHSESTIFVSWLPLFHDMGLIGNVLQPLYLGVPSYIMPPTAFLQKPWCWLRAVSRYRATTSGGPNFAYDLCVEKITPQQRAELDLSSWRVAFNGAEPVRAQTLKRFTETFVPCGFRSQTFYPCYGLAEATLLVTGGLAAEKPVIQPIERTALEQNRAQAGPSATREIVGCGRSWGGQLVIVCPDTLSRLEDEQIGEIWVASKSVAQGYWQQSPDEQTFQAYLATGEGPFLRTGDLGFLQEGELFVTGRLKDLIIIRGRNIYPQDIEWTVERSHEALRSGCGAAFAVEFNGERLVVVQEVERTHRRRLDVDETIAAIRSAVSEQHELDVYAVVLLETGSVPKTSSGKIQRQACRQQFLTKRLATLGESILNGRQSAQPPSSERLALEEQLRDRLSQITGIAASKIDHHSSLTSLGLNSLKAIEIKNFVEAEFNCALPMASFWENLSLTGLADRIQSQNASPAPAPPVPQRLQTAPSTSNMQFSLFYFSSTEADTTNKYRLLIEGAKFADQNGLSAVWVPERHFHAFGGLYPNPSVLGAALAMVTQNLRIRAGSVVLPLHHPLRVAEEWSVVDNLSQGRIDLAFARGWNPNDFVLAPSAYDSATDVLHSGIETIRKLWRGESLPLPNGEGKQARVRLHPSPHQSELPMWLTCSGGKERFVEAGTLGVNVLTALLFQPLEELAEKIALYRQARHQHGHDSGHVTLMLHTFVGEDLDVVRRKVEKPFKDYLKSSVNLWRQGAKNLQDLDEQEQEHLLTYAFERYFQTALFGTPQTCQSLVNQLAEIGVNEIACLIDFGVEEDSVLSALYSLKKLKQLSQSNVAATKTDRTSIEVPVSGESRQFPPSPFPKLTQLPSVPGGRTLTLPLSPSLRDNFPVPPGQFPLSPPQAKPFPLSYGQQALWFFYELNPESAAYNTAFAVRVSSNLDIRALRQALQALVARHPSLRTVFYQRDGKPVQEVKDTGVPFETINAQGWSESELKREAMNAYQRPFNLKQGPPLRSHLFTQSEQHVFLLVIHHIVRDGWSMLVLVDELRQLYVSERRGQTVTLPPLEHSYQDFVKWQGERLASDERLGDYWQKQLADLPVLNLPTDKVRSAPTRGGTYTFKLTSGILQRLQALAQVEEATLFMTLLAAFQILLHRYSGQNDLVVGSPMAGRNAAFARTVGYLVNLVALRAKFAGNLSFKAFLAQVRQTVLEAIAHQDYPLSLLVERLPQQEHPVQVTFTLIEELPHSEVTKLLVPSEAVVDWDGLQLQPFVIPQEEGQFDLSLEVVAEHDICVLKYNSDLFAEETISRMAGHWQTLLEGIGANPEQPVSHLPLLTGGEQQQLAQWNATQVDYPQGNCIHERVEEQVERTPDAVAVEFDDQHLTYRELNVRANRLAHTLQGMGVGPEVLVGICAMRSLDLVVGLLGILKAGGTYVPLDPAYPDERLAFMLKDAQPAVLMTQQALVPKLPPHPSILCLDDERISKTQTNPVSGVSAENLAYVVYTSGTTGKPKGVLVPHSGLLNLVFWHQRTFAVTPSDRATQLAGIAFDALGWELWTYLTAGATVCLVKPEVLLSPEQLQTWLVERQITISFLPTPLAERVLSLEWSDPVSLRLLLTGGDKLHSYPSALPFQVVNNYGPTENTVVTTSGVVTAHQALSPPIGRPIANTQVYILDPQLQPVPVGIPGELYIGGAGLARGYLNRPELTAEKFIPNPFLERTENQEPRIDKSNRPFPPYPFPLTLYKTGDLARYLPDGNIEYLGRLDRQVKIRGFRIELGEIEAVLADCPGVQQAAVTDEGSAGHQRLVAYVVPSQEKPTGTELRNILLQKLPEYMVPSVFMLLETLPLTPNGKIDRRALPAPEPVKEWVPPRTPTQAVIAAIWAEVLGVEVGMHHNFFELGGHSLLVMQVVSRVREAFAIALPVQSLFTAPTLEAFSEQVESARQEGLGPIPSIEPVPRQERLPLSFAQERLWFLEQLEGGAVYNVSGALRLSGSLQVEKLKHAFAAVVERHEVLRSRFPVDEGMPVQVISDGELKVPFIDLQDVATEQAAQVQSLLQQEAQTPFDLASGPLLRVKLLRLAPNEHVLMVTLHHIVCDGWSVNILLRELSAFYQASERAVPKLPVQYADFAAWQRRWLRGVLNTQLDYWRQQLEGAPPLLELPTDKARPPVQSFAGRSESFELSPELTTQLKALRQSGTTLFMILLAAFGVLLSRYSRQEDLVIGTAIANRNHRELEPLIGFFANTLALRLDTSGDPSFAEFLQRVRQVTLGAYTHQDLPFEQLVETLQPERSLSYSPLFQTMFVFEEITEIELPGLEGSIVETDSTTAKFDLTLAMRETESGLQGRWEYSCDLFEAATVRRLSEHFQTLLAGIVANPEQPVSRLPLLTEPEHQLRQKWNGTSLKYPSRCLHELFEDQVERTPDAVAVVFQEERLTYRELNERANQLAHHLQKLGVGPEVLVGICAERSPLMIVGLLAILKAGGAYLPLDPSYPTERLAFMLADAQVQVLLTQETLVAIPEAPQIVYLNQERQEPRSNLASETTPDSLAYVIYTSGSTGKPKGVAIAHHSSVALVQWARTLFSAEELAGVLASTSICFDLSVFELFVPLCWGGRVILALDALQLPSLPAAAEVTLVNTVPSAIAELIRTKSLPQGLKTVNLAGEALPNHLVQQLYQQGIEKVYNLYGPTEDTTYSTFALIEKGAVGSPSIGRPIANTQAYILDPQLQPVPIGVPGELYIGGAGLARGYLNRPELTAEKFIPNPFLEETENQEPRTDPFPPSPFPLTLYKTGDLARYLPDGNIEYLGRLDRQVKIRGFRIELGEIEAVLGECPGVQQAVVTGEGSPGEQRLVAYVVSTQQPTCLELRNYLRQKLPEYMVPAVFMLLDALPLTPNGKIDRRALPAPEPIASETESVPPRTPTQAVIAAIWAEVLGVEVGIRHNFFELGGHSLLATQVVSRVREAFSVELPLKSLFTAATVEELSQQVEAARQAELGLVEAIEPADRNQALPLSFAQQRLWFLEQLGGDTSAYNMPAALHLSGALDKSALEQALSEITRRHEVLRTRFPMQEGVPIQVIEPVSVSLPVIDLQNLPAEQQTAQVQRLAEQEARSPFDLAQGPLLRVVLLQLAATEHVLLLTMHHIICDGWSLGILMREVSAFYQASTSGAVAALPELPLQYADFAVWQRQWLKGVDQLGYWKQQLAGAPPLLLPTDKPRPPVQTFSGGSEPLTLPPKLTAQLKALSQQCGTTLFMTLLAALGILLSRYSRQEDIVIGSPIANRNRRELEPLIGFFANTLALRLNLQGNPSLRELLQRVRQVTLEAYTHQDLPFEQLVEVQPERSLSHSPLFQTMFALQNAPFEDLTLPGLTWTTLESSRHHTQFELTLSLQESASGLKGVWEYNCDLFEAATISRLSKHYQTLLKEIVTSPEQPLAQLSLLTPAQKQKLIEWNATETEYPAQTIAQLFEEQVRQTPDAIAVEWQHQTLTYQELNTRANQLAHYLQRLGIGPDVLVGICAERSLDTIVGLLGILKAGGAYVPLDPTYPNERLEFMLADTGVTVLLTQQHLVTRFDPHQASGQGSPLPLPPSPLPGASHKVCLDDWNTLAQESPANPLAPVTVENLAYVMYTSGSTGTPKGVVVPQRAVVRLVCHTNYIHINSQDTIAQVSNTSFDAATFEIWGALLNGAKLSLIERDTILSPEALAHSLQEREMTIVFLTTALFNQIASHCPQAFHSLKCLLTGGEAISPDKVKAVLNHPPQRLLHVYGPTESTTFATWYEITETATTIPIGRPIANTQTYILDPHLQPVPVGVPGELYLGGAGLAYGYLNRPELTAEHFIPNPFLAGTENQKPRIDKSLPSFPRDPLPLTLYRTGDLARYLPDGHIEYLGRIDHQLKLRGFRIEPGEIEAVLNQHPKVREAVVIACKDNSGNQCLVAYLVPQSQPSIKAIRSFLQEKLPEYMVPSAFVELTALPLTPNGKVDRRALPDPDLKDFEQEAFVAPRTPTEEILASIWTEVLGLAQISIHNNFFAVGGHSLLATQLVSRVRQTFSVELPLRDLFAAPTVEQLSLAIEALRGASVATPTIEPASRSQELPLSFAQQRLWFLAQLEVQSTAYSMPAAIQISGNLQLPALEQAVAEIVQRHEVLRTTFKVVDGVPVQAIAPRQNIPLSVVDLQSSPEPMAQVKQRAIFEAQQPFDLSQGPLLRVVLLQLSGDSWVLLVNMHHIVSDGWSVGIFIRELSALYKAFCQGDPSPLPPLPIQYADFAAWQRQWLAGEMLDQQLHYWQQQLAGAPLLLELPTDRPRPPVQSFRGSTLPVQLDGELTEALKTLSQQSGATLFMTLLAAFAILVARYSNQDDLVIGSPIANRNRREIEPLIGFFVNTLALRINLQDNLSFRELLEQVRTCALDAYAHQDLPFERLVEEMQPERDLDRTPLVQVVFALQNAPAEAWQLPGLSLKPLEFDYRSVRFDLECHLWELTEGLSGYLIYNTDLFDASTISRLAHNFQTLLTAIVANPDRQVFSLPLLTEAERHQILSWNDTKMEYPQECIHELFEAQVKRTPDAVAVVHAHQHLSYRELNQQANQLASYLQTLGVGPDVLVGICTERSLLMVVGLLGILKAGGAYVPLDPTYPPARLSSLLQDSQVSILLTQQKLIPQLPPHPAQVVCLDGEGFEEKATATPSPFPFPPSPQKASVTPENLAYVIYTSGSTGHPKGVLVTHRGVSNLVSWHQRTFAVSSADRTTQLARTAFDASAWEIWSALCTGAQLYLVEDDILHSPRHLQRWLTSNKITIAFLPTPLAEEVLALPWSEDTALRILLTGGDRLHQYPSPTLPFQLINNYGPTETTVVATSGLVSPANERRLPAIGCPINNTQVYILDKHLQPVPIGVPGELHISGAGVARGYLNRPELTQEKFIPNPFLEGTENQEPKIDKSNLPFPPYPFPLTLYKTGDRARYLSDGNIEYLGRSDEQVKLRGFRLEPGEIEKELLKHFAVQEAAVVVRGEQLVAYIVPTSSHLEQWQTEHLSHWQILYEQTYKQEHSYDATFNIVGWNSSYTNLPLPAEEMRTWVNRTVERILHQQPQRVLEIGCGTGLLLSKIAPHCTQYWGTDYSQAAIESVQQLQEVQGWKHVTSMQRMADDFEGIEEAAFDAVILNSVVQYFPSIDYLLRVIESSLKAVEPGGFIFVGDVRSLPLLEAYHASVALEHDSPVEVRRVEQRIAQEEELVIDPAFFVALQQQFPRITRVHVQPKRGRDRSELTLFRYDVILHVETEADTLVPTWLDWHHDRLTMSAVRQLSDELIGIKNVPNARLSRVLKLVELLKAGVTTNELRAAQREEGVDPEDWWSLDVPGTVYVSQLSDRGAGFYDVIIQRTPSATKPLLPIKIEHSVKPWHTYANNPLQGKASQLAPQLREFLRQTLPDYLIPSTFVVLETLPLTPNGKLDKRALPAPTRVGGGVAPRTSIEKELVAIWSEVLGVQVGIHDSFFELGGHSLLAVRLVAQIEQHFGKNLPLATLFQNPTIEHLARHLHQPSSWSPLVPIQEGGSQRPFFCVPGAGGNVIYFYDLARSLGPNQPVFGLQALGLDGQSEPYTDIRDIAAAYTQAIQSVQPQGPYCLGGHSFGAHVAFEMAQQLQRQGHEVARLVVFDAPAPTAHRQAIGSDWDTATWLAQIATVAERLVGENLGLTAETLRFLEPEEQLRTFAKHLKRINLLPPEAGTTQVRGLVQVYRANCQASYELPQEIAPMRIMLFRAMEPSAGDASLEDPTWGWSRFASKPVELHFVPGDHITMMTGSHVQVLAQRLKTLDS